MLTVTCTKLKAIVSKNIYLLLGVVQGIVTGIRGLCNGIGPAMYGLVFYLFHVDLSDKKNAQAQTNSTLVHEFDSNIVSIYLICYLRNLLILLLFSLSSIYLKQAYKDSYRMKANSSLLQSKIISN